MHFASNYGHSNVRKNNGANSVSLIDFVDLSVHHYMQSVNKKMSNKMTQTMKARDKWIEHLDEYERQKKSTTEKQGGRNKSKI